MSPIRESELLDFTPKEWAILDGGGMETYDLPPERMADVFALKRLRRLRYSQEKRGQTTF